MLVSFKKGRSTIDLPGIVLLKWKRLSEVHCVQRLSSGRQRSLARAGTKPYAFGAVLVLVASRPACQAFNAHFVGVWQLLLWVRAFSVSAFHPLSS